MNDSIIRFAFRGTLGAFDLDVACDVPATGITGLFGPSGCGKTTILRAIAGLQRFRDGTCIVDGEVWQDAGAFRPPHLRPIGYVFQEASLFSHLSVRGNLMFGARDVPEQIFAETIDLLGLGKLINRDPYALSGGERQRVAIGRALLSQPRLLLMDEPLSALDRATRAEILPFLERLHASLALPILYVTHDSHEIERLADHLVLMERGRSLAAGPVEDVLGNLDLPLARDSDAAVVIEAQVTDTTEGEGLARVSMPGGSILMPRRSLSKGGALRIRIAAGNVSLALSRPADSSILNILPGRIRAFRLLGEDEILVALCLGEDGSGARILSRVSRYSWQRLNLAEGSRVFAQIKGVSLTLR